GAKARRQHKGKLNWVERRLAELNVPPKGELVSPERNYRPRSVFLRSFAPTSLRPSVPSSPPSLPSSIYPPESKFNGSRDAIHSAGTPDGADTATMPPTTAQFVSMSPSAETVVQSASAKSLGW